MKILIIAGHGAGDPGATASIGGKLYREADETRDLVPRVAAELKARFEITADVFDPSRNAYAEIRSGKLLPGAFSAYGCVLELHFNACAAGAADGRRKGVECYVPSGGGTAAAAALCKSLEQLGFPNRGVKQKNFTVIAAAKRAGAESALLETCFLDDPDDMALYLQSKDAVAAAIAAAIAAAFRLPARKRSSRALVQEAAGLSDATMRYLESYRWGKELLDKLAAAITR